MIFLQKMIFGLIGITFAIYHPVFAQNIGNYPNKPIRLIVPFAAGGGGDVMARILAQKLTQSLGQNVYIENKAGAGSIIGTQYVANAAPDGYTLLVGSSAIVVNPALNSNTAGYNPEKDFIPIVIAATQPMVIAVNQSFSAKTLNDLKDIALKEKLAFASAGTGTQPHVTCENLFANVLKSDIPHIPYKGIAPAITALIGGEIPVYCGSPVGISQLVKAGKLRVLAVTSDKRLPNIPEAPTIGEAGYPQIKSELWQGIFAPAKTPAAIIQKINLVMNQTITMAEVIEKLDQSDFVTVGGSSKQTAEFVLTEIQRWNKFAAETKINLAQ